MQQNERTCAKKSEFAIEELKLLQQVIARHERHVFLVYGALLALVVAVTAAALFRGLRATWKLDLAIASLLLGFGVWLAYHRLKIFYATRRALYVESRIRRCTDTYEGPCINASLIHPVVHGGRASLTRMLGDAFVWVPLLLAALVIFASLAAAPAVIGGPLTPTDPGASGKPSGDTLSMAIFALLQQSDPTRSVVSGVLVLAALLLVVGAALLLFGRNVSARVAGGAALTVGLLTHGALIKDLTIEKLFNLDKFAPAIELAINNKLQGLTLAPQYLGTISGFASGEAGVDTNGFAERLHDVETQLDTICKKWHEHAVAGRTMLMIVGSTDRVPLTGATRQQFDANTGLARARAESVKAYLQRSCWDKEKVATFDQASDVLVLVSGPQTTPAISGTPAGTKPGGYPADRRVDVYLVSAGVALPTQPMVRPVEISARNQ